MKWHPKWENPTLFPLNFSSLSVGTALQTQRYKSRHRKTDRKMDTTDRKTDREMDMTDTEKQMETWTQQTASTFKYSLEVHTSSSVAIIIMGISSA